MYVAINEAEMVLFGEIQAPVNLPRVLRRLEAYAIGRALQASHGCKSSAARMLGMKRTSLHETTKRLKRFERAEGGWQKIIEG